MADTGAEEFRDPDNKDSLVDIVQKSVVRSIAKNLVQATHAVANKTAAAPTVGSEQRDGATVPSGEQDEPDGGTGSVTESVVSRLVRALADEVGKVIDAHRKDLEEALELVIHLQGDQLKQGIRSIWEKLFQGKNFKWSHLLSFLAFAALLVYRKGPGAELLSLARTVAICVGELIVKMWRAAFVELGGWFGFLKQQGAAGAVVDGAAADNSLSDRVGSAAVYAVLLVALGYGLYWVWKDASCQPPKPKLQ